MSVVLHSRFGRSGSHLPRQALPFLANGLFINDCLDSRLYRLQYLFFRVYMATIEQYPEKKSAMDKIDRHIIELLRNNARLTYRELGERVYLSANTVADRVRRLIEDKVLLGFHADVNLVAMELPLQALIDIKLLQGTSAGQFEAAIAKIPGIIEASLMTGTHDYMLRVACIDQTDLVRLIEALRDRAGVQDRFSRLILRRIQVDAPLRDSP